MKSSEMYAKKTLPSTLLEIGGGRSADHKLEMTKKISAIYLDKKNVDKI